MSQLVVRKAIKKDLDAVKELADSHRSELGFVLRPALSRSISREEVLIAENSTGVIGFVEYHHREDKQTTLYHIAVIPNYRRKGIGRALVDALRSEAKLLGKRKILLKCPIDLPANGFYSRLGFQSVRKEEGKARNLHVWVLPFSGC
jgi:N-acetylglutamate synthase-like GNAT family acetyltransferase